MPQMPPSLAHSIAASPIRRRSVALGFAGIMAVLLLAGVAGYVLWLRGQPGVATGTFLLGLVLASLLSTPALLLLWWLDRRERETGVVFIGILLFGVVLGMVLALLLTGGNAQQVLEPAGFGPADLRSFDPLSQNTLPLEKIADDEIAKLAGGSAVLAPVFEEFLKLLALALIILFLRGEFDSVRDGIIYGALLGLGFTIAESAYYVTDGLLRTGSLPLAQQMAARYVFFGLSGHTLFGALLGAGFGLARQEYVRTTRIVALIVFFLLGLFAHLIHNTLTFGVAGMMAQLLGVGGVALKDLPAPVLWLCMAGGNLFTLGLFFAIVINLLERSGRWERDVIASELAAEVGKAITADEYRLLVSEGLFGLRTVPHASARTARAIVNAQNELAFRKWRVRFEGGAADSDPIAAAWREDIAHLRERAR